MSRADLESAGMCRRAIERALREGALVRLRVGWYADRSTDPDLMAAVRCGGSVTCVAALTRYGVWTARSELHVRVGPADRVHGRASRIHRQPGLAMGGVDLPLTAMRIACDCLTFEEAVCALDSALNQGVVTRSSLVAELRSAAARRALRWSDGRSESGIETLARLRLLARGLRVRVQVPIRGIGRVDLIVGERLVVELDGDAWHSTRAQREADRRRDSALLARGYLVVRAGFSRVMDDWPGFESELMAVVRRRDHRWRMVHRRDRDVW